MLSTRTFHGVKTTIPSFSAHDVGKYVQNKKNSSEDIKKTKNFLLTKIGQRKAGIGKVVEKNCRIDENFLVEIKLKSAGENGSKR
jgi:hypothetical protein